MEVTACEEFPARVALASYEVGRRGDEGRALTSFLSHCTKTLQASAAQMLKLQNMTDSPIEIYAQSERDVRARKRSNNTITHQDGLS